MYIKRTLEKAVLNIMKGFPAIMITGPRQVGKTTIIEELSKQGHIKYDHVTLDDPNERLLAKTDPKLFLDNHKPPVFIDEFQYATELLPYIKMIIDQKTREDNLNASGLFILTGSQMFKMMKDVSESLAGRVSILNMFSLSNNELCSDDEKPFMPTFDYIKAKGKNERKDLHTLYDSFITGSMPRMHLGLNIKPNTYYAEYIQTY